MSDRIFIGVAWPYANGPIHLGGIAGCYLPADIFARFHRMRGNQVLMVSGTDQHGTPVTIRAEQEGLSPQVVVEKYHQEDLTVWERLGITFDRYTSTGTDNHRAVVHDIFLRLLDRDLIYKQPGLYAYCDFDRRFLPDRYVEGTCPHCGSDRARGDQCETCGKPLDPQDLINWRCRTCGNPPVMKESEHFFLRLSALQSHLEQWSTSVGADRWRPNVYGFTKGWLAEGMRDRAITRDIDWGVSVPVPGYDEKRVYVWFEAVCGYLSAAVEWAAARGEPDAWRAFWQDPACRAFYFIGKDNIAFHTIMWPAIIMGYGAYDPATGGGEYNLPYDVPANEFLSLEGQKFSTSQNWAVWAPDYLDRFDPDPLRYYLSANMPEYGDADFSWREFLRRNNDELVATYGNLVHRVLTLTHRNFDGRVPESGPLDDVDTAIRRRADAALDDVAASLEGRRFREAIGRGAMALATEANRYVDLKAPWRTAKKDREATATTLVTALYVLSALKTVMYPFLPFSSEKLHRMLGFDGRAEERGWTIEPPPAGQSLERPQPLFTKLDDGMVEEETDRLSRQRASA